MINNPHILALLARERQQTLIAEAQAARLATRPRVAARVTRRLVSALGARHAVPAPTELVRAVLSGDVEAISGRLTDGPIFYSPIRSYADRP